MKIAYITTSFGSLSHTFIRREVFGLRELGVEISLFGIRPEKAGELSGAEQKLANETIYLYPLKIFAVIKANAWFIRHKTRNYFTALKSVITNEEQNASQHIKLIYHFFVSPYIALGIEKTGARHIHAHFLNVSATMAMHCSELTGIPFSISVHSAGIAHLKEMIGLKSKLKKAVFIRTISDYNKEYISKIIFPCAEKIHVVRCGINLFEYTINKTRIFAQDKLKIVAIGRFVEKKGFEYTVEAAKLLKEEGAPFKLSMIGDGPLRAELQGLANRHDIGEEVIFTGYLSQEKINTELAKSDILIAASVEAKTGEKEGIPVTIIEAMAAGILVIATDHSGIPEVVKDKETGLLVPEKDPMAIAEAIKLAQKDDNLRKNCIANARKLAEDKFDIRKTAGAMKRLFEENL